MSNRRIAFAAVALALLSSTAAFAQGDHYPEPLNIQPSTTQRVPLAVGPYVSTQSSEAYPTFSPSLSSPTLSQPMIAENNGSESGVNPINSVPKGFDVGTQAYADQQVLNKWYANQEAARPHYANAGNLKPVTGYGVPADGFGAPQRGNGLSGG